MTSSYRIRQLAENDLEQIWLYSFHKWGLDQADRYIRSMISRFSWLAENPQLGKQRNDIKSGYYGFLEGRHIIFYTIKKNGIDIIGIPHQRMDIMSHFE
ncbi:type II toxin-antitoxin system RelE/ParE family toxin [Candidatus Methylobacter oryzae]|uniref:Toxin n=1 Tax=Candidatus Methylobacter oryzae TaxID=2497749 RepID=A0ABY3CB41_9GAMM|nr:type II toxin-antitoxin system RelE/ParE family toxin [Candidatus Methylobacter oryzae]TRW95867.1 type II toxin-antitoxin system RelE/ParE family toxin [Candidatus Methylobacter oryzae]